MVITSQICNISLHLKALLAWLEMMARPACLAYLARWGPADSPVPEALPACRDRRGFLELRAAADPRAMKDQLALLDQPEFQGIRGLLVLQVLWVLWGHLANRYVEL